jgi:hypothetical protein
MTLQLPEEGGQGTPGGEKPFLRREKLMSSTRSGWAVLVAANALIWGMLSLDDASHAAPQPGRQPFVNAVEQRNEIILQLQQIKSLLEEQNRLLRKQANAVDGPNLPR